MKKIILFFWVLFFSVPIYGEVNTGKVGGVHILERTGFVTLRDLLYVQLNIFAIQTELGTLPNSITIMPHILNYEIIAVVLMPKNMSFVDSEISKKLIEDSIAGLAKIYRLGYKVEFYSSWLEAHKRSVEINRELEKE